MVKTKADSQKAKCKVKGCQEDAAYGFREIIDQNSVTESAFETGVVSNWCEQHDAKKRKAYQHLTGEFVTF